MDHASLKKQLRKKHKALRKGLSDEGRAQLSVSMLRHFQDSDLLEGINHLHLFLSIERFSEPDTFLFVNWMRAQHPNILLSVPIVEEGTPHLSHIHLSPRTRIEISDWGIPEPKPPFEQRGPGDFDLILVPLLAFDEKGQRLGYGKGMYDRFLAQTRPDCRKIGICYAFNEEISPLPSDEFDVPLDGILTENELRFFE